MTCNSSNTPYGVTKRDSIPQGDTYDLSYGVSGVSDLTGWTCYLQVTNPVTQEAMVSREVTQMNGDGDRFITTLTSTETNLPTRSYIVGAQLTDTTTTPQSTGEIIMELTITEQWVQVP